MASKGQLKMAHRFVEKVQKESPIHKFDLMDLMGISIATYNSIKPYVEHRFPHYVEYDKKDKVWRAKEVIPEPKINRASK